MTARRGSPRGARTEDGNAVRTETATLGGHALRRLSARILDRTLELVAPADPEALLDSAEVIERFEKDEYLPYWSDLWPSAVLLALLLAREGGPPGGQRTLLELGCGLGLASVAAAHAGWAVTASDYDEDALVFAAHNAACNGARIATRRIDWRDPDAACSYDRIVASDLLYERRNAEPIARFVASRLAPGGEAWIVDPFRDSARGARGSFRAAGLDVRERPLPFDPAGTHRSFAHAIPRAGLAWRERPTSASADTRPGRALRLFQLRRGSGG